MDMKYNLIDKSDRNVKNKKSVLTVYIWAAY